MENLTQWIVYGVLIAVSYMFVGYHIAQLSRDVRKNRYDKTLNGISVLPLMVFLYPLIINDLAKNGDPKWLLLNESRYDKPLYVVFHLFFWPIRIVGNLGVIALLFIIAPIIAFLAAMVMRMITGAIEAVVVKIKGETNS